jgi:hypothetical protein
MRVRNSHGMKRHTRKKKKKKKNRFSTEKKKKKNGISPYPGVAASVDPIWHPPLAGSSGSTDMRVHCELWTLRFGNTARAVSGATTNATNSRKIVTSIVF